MTAATDRGEQRTEVGSCRRWVRTGIRLDADQQYHMVASGCWADLRKRCGPDGYPSREYPTRVGVAVLTLTSWLRRVRSANWFALIGAVDSARPRKFAIGTAAVITARRSGELLCFANDVWFAYSNNDGSVTLSVIPLSG